MQLQTLGGGSWTDLAHEASYQTTCRMQLQNLIKRDPLAYKDEVLCVSLLVLVHSDSVSLLVLVHSMTVLVY